MLGVLLADATNLDRPQADPVPSMSFWFRAAGMRSTEGLGFRV